MSGPSLSCSQVVVISAVILALLRFPNDQKEMNDLANGVHGFDSMPLINRLCVIRLDMCIINIYEIYSKHFWFSNNA